MTMMDIGWSDLWMLVVAIIPIGPLISGGASLLGLAFGGGGPSDEEKEAQAAQLELIKELLPILKRSQELDAVQTLRSQFLTDPRLANTGPARGLADELGLDLSSLTSGSVPLKEALINGFFGQLPRWARAQAGGTFLGTPQQQALADASPTTRFGRGGFGTREFGQVGNDSLGDVDRIQSSLDVIRRSQPQADFFETQTQAPRGVSPQGFSNSGRPSRRPTGLVAVRR